MKNRREILRVHRPAGDLQILLHTRDIPPLDKSMKALDQSRLVEHLRQFLKHIAIAILVHDLLLDISAENHTGIPIHAMRSDIAVSILTEGLECTAHLIHIGERDRLHLIQRHKIMIRHKPVLSPCHIIEHLCTAHHATARQPAKAAYAPKQIGFPRPLRCEFDEVQLLFGKGEEPCQHRQLLFLARIPCGVVVHRPQQHIHPFFGCEVPSCVLIVV